MNVTSVDDTVEVRSKNGMLRLIPDGTGLAPSTRSEWIHHRHKVKRGWIRLSAMVDHDTMKVLAFRVTDETHRRLAPVRGPPGGFAEVPWHRR